MTQIPYLPVISVQIAFNPTNVFSLTQTWTDATLYLRDFTTTKGRQHFLDRIEAGRIDLTLDGRDGFFFNGSTNGTGYVLQPRCPVKVTATYGLVTYNIFYGLIDSIEEQTTDQLNIDLRVVASDMTKFISLKTMSNPNFYPSLAKVSSTANYFRLGGLQPYVITGSTVSAVGSTTYTTTYYANNAYTAGQKVSVFGLLDALGNTSLLNVENATVASASASSFSLTVNSKTSTTSLTIGTGSKTFNVGGYPVGAVITLTNAGGTMTGTVTQTTTTSTTFTVSSTTGSGTYASWKVSPALNVMSTVGNGITYASTVADQVGTSVATYQGQVSFPQYGALVYDPNNCTDFANGSGSPSALMTITSPGTGVGVEFWFRMTGSTSSSIICGMADSGFNNYLDLTVSDGTHTDTITGVVIPVGNAMANLITSSPSVTTSYFDLGISVTDGYWHHIGVYTTATDKLTVFCDGNFTQIGISSASTSVFSEPVFGMSGQILTLGGTYVPNFPGMIDEIVIPNSTVTKTAILNRFIAGSLLARGLPTTEDLYTTPQSTTSLTVGTGSKTFTIPAGWNLVVGGKVTAYATTGLGYTASMTGTVTSYSGTSLVINVTSTTGSGTFAKWYIKALYLPAAVYSADRAAEVLILAGFGSVANGTLSIPSGTFYIGTSISNPAGTDYSTLTPYFPTSTNSNGVLTVQPYYWDSPIFNNSALDLMYQITDTDIGAFWQRSDGTFRLNVSSYYGTWSGSTWTSASSTGTYTPPSAQTWSDDGNASYYYQADSLSIMRDDADLWTMVKVTPQSGIEQIYENTANEARWGYTTMTKASTLHTSQTDALSTATFLGYLYQSPLPRVQNAEMKARVGNGGNLAAMLSTTLGDVVLFQRYVGNTSTSLYSRTGTYPSVKGVIVQNMMVESVTHVFNADPGEWITHFTLDPYPTRP